MNNNPTDSFAELDLSEFKKNSAASVKVATRNLKEEKAAIRAVAEQSDFQSRQPKVKGSAIIPRTFSLFQEEYDIINNSLRAYLLRADLGNSQPSASDVIRAALYLLAEQSPEEIVALIKTHKGRGRK